MKFEFDPTKSASNEGKHGLYFIAAQALWIDANRVRVAAKTIAGKHYTVIVTYRRASVRIISARPSSPAEIQIYERHKTKRRKAPMPISTAAFDAKFDRGEDISEHLDLGTARTFAPGEDETLDLTPQKVNVDFPAWVVAALDAEADRIGIARQALIKLWIVECIKVARKSA